MFLEKNPTVKHFLTQDATTHRSVIEVTCVWYKVPLTPTSESPMLLNQALLDRGTSQICNASVSPIYFLVVPCYVEYT